MKSKSFHELKFQQNLDYYNSQALQLFEEYSKYSTLDLTEEFRVKLCTSFQQTNLEIHEESFDCGFIFKYCNFIIKNRTTEKDQLYYFLHVPRCAGNSVNSFLNENNIPHVKAIYRINPTKEVSHISTRKNQIDYFSWGTFCSTPWKPEDIREAGVKVFTTVRNPYAWLVSMYFYGKDKFCDTFEEYRDTIYGVGNLREIFPDFESFFDFFIKDVKDSDPISWLKPFRENPYFQMWDENKEFIPDKVLKVENLQEEISEFLSIENGISKLNAGVAKKHYKEYYTRAMRERFEQKHGWLLEYFGYEF